MTIIRKEILINAPVAKVWRYITDPAKIAGWLMENDFEARPGKEFRMACGQEGPIQCQVLEIVPEKKLVYSWASAQIPIKTLVTITLSAENQKTRLVLVHSGWDTLPPSEQEAARPFDQGWNDHLKTLTDQIHMEASHG